VAGSIQKSDVYARMKPEDGRRLMDFLDVMVIKWGGINEGLDPKIVELTRQDKGFIAAPPDQQKAYLAHIDPNFPKEPLYQNAYLAHLTGIAGTVIDVYGTMIEFIPGVSLEYHGKTFL